jgi:hypothetical protein
VNQCPDRYLGAVHNFVKDNLCDAQLWRYESDVRRTQMWRRETKRCPDVAGRPLAGYAFAWSARIFALAPSPGQRHISTMDEDNPFTINIELHVKERVRRYEWSICENGQPREHSTESYTTMREARVDADKAMEKIVSVWRADE